MFVLFCDRAAGGPFNGAGIGIKGDLGQEVSKLMRRHFYAEMLSDRLCDREQKRRLSSLGPCPRQEYREPPLPGHLRR